MSSDIPPPRSPNRTKQVVGVGLFISSMIGLALAIEFWTPLHQALLGYSKAPAGVIIPALGILAGWQYLACGRASAGRVLLATVLFVIPLLPSAIIALDSSLCRPLVSRTFGALAACACVAIAGAFVYEINGPKVTKAAYIFVGAYVDAVYICNAFLTTSYTDFFGKGWTT
jgi:hypothetical protein